MSEVRELLEEIALEQDFVFKKMLHCKVCGATEIKTMGHSLNCKFEKFLALLKPEPSKPKHQVIHVQHRQPEPSGEVGESRLGFSQKTMNDMIAQRDAKHIDYENEKYRAEQLQAQLEIAIKRVGELQAKIDRQAFVIHRFENWYSDTGCPRSETKESFCPDHDKLIKKYNKEMQGLNESERYGFDPEEECEHSEMCGYCYARYYEKLFNEKKANDSKPATS